MPKHLFKFSCPCCNKTVEVDTRSGKARAVRAEDARGGGLDDLLEAHRKEGDRLDDVFSSAQDDERRRADRLEKELRRAKDEAKDAPDERPRNPFDLE